MAGNFTTFTSGEVTFTAPAGSSLEVGDFTGFPFFGNEIRIVGPDYLDIAIASPVSALGIAFADGVTPSSFLVTLRNGGVYVGEISIDAPVNFIGVSSDEVFDEMQIRETTQNDSEDEYFQAVLRNGELQAATSVVGNLCAGLDCVNGESFATPPLKLKENNVRIRYIDTAVAAGLGQSWNVEANSFQNGAPSYLGFQVKSLTLDGLRLSEGNAPVYDCTQSVPLGQQPPTTGELIPEGEPVIAPVAQDVNGFWDCDTIPDFTVQNVLRLGNQDTGVRIGHGSRASADVISLGRSGMVRRLRRVASALAATDALTVQALNDFDLLDDQRPRQLTLSGRLDDLEAEVNDIENLLTTYESDTDNDGLSYYREVFLHDTDPERADTDGDGAIDGQEVASGMDPNDGCDGPIQLCGSLLRLIIPIIEQQNP